MMDVRFGFWFEMWILIFLDFSDKIGVNRCKIGVNCGRGEILILYSLKIYNFLVIL